MAVVRAFEATEEGEVVGGDMLEMVEVVVVMVVMVVKVVLVAVAMLVVAQPTRRLLACMNTRPAATASGSSSSCVWRKSWTTSTW